MDCHISVQMEGMIEEMDKKRALSGIFLAILKLGSLYMVFLKV